MLNKKYSKKAQFYLLAAIIIIAVVIGFATVTNYAKKGNQIKIYDLGEELGIEGGEVLDYGTIKGDVIDVAISEIGGGVYTSEEIIEHFTAIYDVYAGGNKEIYYVFGNVEGRVIAYTYKEVQGGSISLTIGESTPTTTTIQRAREELQADNIDGKIRIAINQKNYDFNLKSGENFYFVISQKIGEDEYVITS